MKKLLATGAVLAAVFAAFSSPAFAARRAAVGYDTPSGAQMLARPSDVVVTEGRVVGADPDANIRTQLLRNPDQSGF